MKTNILVIDDDADVLTAVNLLLKTEAQKVVTERNPEKLPSLITSGLFDLVLLDMNFNASINTGNEGLYWLKRIKEMKPDASVIMITAYGDIDLAVRSLKEGASDFVVKPWNNEKLLATIQDLVSHNSQKGNSFNRDSVDLIGKSEVMLDILAKIEKIAPTDANILILGENGTGKDLIAKTIHDKSLRAGKPLVKVDIGALTESLFESELFGHKKGAFTDAREDRAGRFEVASGGTLFLDEIGNISLQQQAKLLSALQNRQITRVGANQNIPIDIRLICATNIPMVELGNENRFRKDLIYRINTVEVVVPPLRKRKEDIPLLSDHFLRIYSEKYLKTNMSFSPAAIQKLKNYHFPGNVRELQYIIERAVIMSDNDKLDPDDLIFSPIEYTDQNVTQLSGETSLSNIEKNTIVRVIEKNNGNISKAAKELGITRTTLYRKLGKYEI
jgi:two-component system, NtrC family, response regulator HydG